LKFSRRSVLAGAFAVGLITLGTTAAVQAAPSLPSPNGTGALQAQAAATAGVIGQNGASQPTHSGTWNAWMDGYGTTHTDTLSQSVAIPAGCH
jgi:hypothetical protein